MKIVDARAWREDLELSRPYTIAYRHIDQVENIFLQLRLEDGRCGLGVAAPAEAVTGESVAASQESLDQLADLARGADLRAYRGLLREAHAAFPTRPAALAAFDMALHDGFCQWIGLPLATYLGQVHESLPTSVTLGISTVEGALREARDWLEQGFTALKLKIGRDVEADIETCRQLRSSLGDRFTLRVDANQGYTPQDLNHFWGAVGNLGIELIEQPLPKSRIEAMRRLPDGLADRCAADETLQRPIDALRLCRFPHPFGIFNIKLMKCGGTQAAREIATLAHRAGIKLMWGCNDESRVSIAAALHTALACPSTRYLDLDGSFDLGRDLVVGGFTLQRGRLAPTDRPGLGVHLLES